MGCIWRMNKQLKGKGIAYLFSWIILIHRASFFPDFLISFFLIRNTITFSIICAKIWLKTWTEEINMVSIKIKRQLFAAGLTWFFFAFAFCMILIIIYASICGIDLWNGNSDMLPTLKGFRKEGTEMKSTNIMFCGFT